MSKTESSIQIVTSLDDFDRLLQIARKHGVLSLKVDGIEVAIPPSAEKEREALFTEDALSRVNVDAEAHLAYKNL